MLNKNLHKECLQYQERLRWTMRAASKLSGNNGPSARAGAQDSGQDISSAVGSMFCLENLQHQSFHCRGDLLTSPIIGSGIMCWAGPMRPVLCLASEHKQITHQANIMCVHSA